MRISIKISAVKISVFSLLFLFCAILYAQDSTDKSLVISGDDSALQWSPCPEFMPAGCELAVLHGNPAEKNADVFLKVPGNAEIAKHRHTSAERMILVKGEMEITYEGEEPVLIKKGNYAYGPANVPHSAKCGDQPCVLFIAFEEPVDAFPVVD